jgi:hypothetical protein
MKRSKGLNDGMAVPVIVGSLFFGDCYRRQCGFMEAGDLLEQFFGIFPDK